MARLNVQAIIEDDRPIALRRKRRSSIGVHKDSTLSVEIPSSTDSGISTPPRTPKHSKKRVRFSDPGPAIESDYASSGLTPFIRRTSLTTVAKPNRRHSTPAILSNRREYNDTPTSGTLQFAPLRQVLDGRVKRRLRRNRLSEEVNNIESEKKMEARQRRSIVFKLRKELELKDAEVQSLRDEHDLASQFECESGISFATNTTLSTKVHELEQEIHNLKSELRNKEAHHDETEHDWTLAAKDPFHSDDEDDNMIMNYDDDFTMNDDEIMTTPRRLNTSFPSPPSTLPNTPCCAISFINAGTQAILPIPDPENEALKSQLESLQSEISKLNSAIAFNNDHNSRLNSKLSDYIPLDQSLDHTSLDSALDRVLTTLTLAQSQTLEQTARYSALSTCVTDLNFSQTSPDEILSQLGSQFRQARLELEYLFPGETTTGFENEKLLDMLLERLHVLVKKVKQQNQSIDQYHDQELLLRQQLNTRVSAMDDMKVEVSTLKSTIEELSHEKSELGTGNERLKEALEGYRTEVQSLEQLITRLENEGREMEAQHLTEKQSMTQEFQTQQQEMATSHKATISELDRQLQMSALEHDRTKADIEGKDFLIGELERRLNAVMKASAELQEQLDQLSSSNQEKDTMIGNLQSLTAQREHAHGEALALRDSKISNLKAEIENITTSLQSAQLTILSLRKENGDLRAVAESEKQRGQFVVNSMRDHLRSVLDMGDGYLNGGDAPASARSSVEIGGSSPLTGKGGQRGMDEYMTPQSGSGRRFLDGELARRPSSEKARRGRRRYDSGLGFLEEEEEEFGQMVESGSDL